ncbi:MAG: ArsR family transcriptional regulator [Chloroflexota bacterium]
MQNRRQEILTILKQKGSATVDELAEMLELTPVTVRHHLDILRAEFLVDAPEVKRRKGPGRPQYVYSLTEEAAIHFPQAYDRLAHELLEEIEELFGPDAVGEMMDQIAKRRILEAPYMDESLSVERRMDALVEFLNKRGYMAQWHKQEDGTNVVQVSNCPYKRTARVHPELCALDLKVLERVSNAEVVNLHRISDGNTSCLYRIRFPSSD